MAFRDPFLSLDDLDRERTFGTLGAINKATGAATQGVLDYNSLMREEEDRREKLKQKAIENAQNDRSFGLQQTIEKRVAENSNRQLMAAERAQTRLEKDLDFDQKQTTDSVERKKANETLQNTVSAVLDEIPLAEDGSNKDTVLRRALEIGDNDPLMKKHYNWRDVQSEMERQLEERQYKNRQLGVQETRAQAAMTNATRPRGVRSPGRGPAGPKLEGLSTGERKEVANIDASLPALDAVLESVQNGSVDPGPVSYLMNNVRQFFGMRKQGDDVGAAQLADVVNAEMNRLYGASVTPHEMQRAMMAMPSFKDDNEGFVALVSLLRDRLVRKRASIIDIAARNVDAKGGDPSRLRNAFSPGGGAPKQAPPMEPGEKRSAYARRLIEAGFPEQDVMKIVMSAKAGG